MQGYMSMQHSPLDDLLSRRGHTAMAATHSQQQLHHMLHRTVHQLLSSKGCTVVAATHQVPSKQQQQHCLEWASPIQASGGRGLARGMPHLLGMMSYMSSQQHPFWNSLRFCTRVACLGRRFPVQQRCLKMLLSPAALMAASSTRRLYERRPIGKHCRCVNNAQPCRTGCSSASAFCNYLHLILVLQELPGNASSSVSNGPVDVGSALHCITVPCFLGSQQHLLSPCNQTVLCNHAKYGSRVLILP